MYKLLQYGHEEKERFVSLCTLFVIGTGKAASKQRQSLQRIK
jgi:hypothetical protein